MSDPSLTLVDRALAFRKTEEFRRLSRYAMASVITTVLSLGLLGLFYGVLRISSAAWCNLYATAITTIPSYYLNRAWAWGKTGRSHLTKEIIPFWTIAIASALISTFFVHFANLGAQHLTHSHEVLTLVVEATNFLTYAVLWVSKFVLFNKVLFKHEAVLTGLRSLDSELGVTEVNGLSSTADRSFGR